MPLRSRHRVGAVLACLLLMAGAACGSSSDETDTLALPATTTLDPDLSTTPTTPVTTVPLTTPFTFAPRDTTPFARGEGTITITGDQQVTGEFSSTSCPGIRVTEARGVQASLAFVSNPNLGSARRWTLDLAGISPGQTTFPEPAGFNQIPPRRVRLSVEILGQVLTWGTTASGGGAVTGTVAARTPNAKSGSFDLELAFTGSEGNTVPLDAHGPVQIEGEWSCPDSE